MSMAEAGPISFTVIVPCRGHAEALRGCLQALGRQTQPPAAVIVVDSAGEEAVADVVRMFPNVQLVRSGHPLLPGAARNLGAAHASTQCIAFIDADCVAEPGWLEAAAVAIRAGARLVGGPVLDLDPWHAIAAADNLLQFVDNSPYRRAGPASHLPSCSLALRRPDFEALGRFPEDMPVGEDVELVGSAARAWGDAVRFAAAMRVRHAGRRTLAGLWRHQSTFGQARGWYGHMLTSRQRRACSNLVLIPGVIVKRWWYIARRSAQYRPASLLRVLVLTPALLVGLLAYAQGLRRGCKAGLAASR